MGKRLRRLPDRFYFSGLLPSLSQLPVAVSYRIAAFWGRRLLRSQDATRETICRNVVRLQNGRSWPPAESIAESVFENLFYEDLDTFHYRKWHPGNLDRFLEFEGLQHLDGLVRGGRGAVLMTAHIGAPCAALVALGVKGFPITHVSREYAGNQEIPPAFRSFAFKKIQLIERRLGRSLINAVDDRPQRAPHTVLEILKCLRQQQLVSMALDVNPDWLPEGTDVRFFGRTARFSPNLVRLAARSEVPVVPYFIVRDKTQPHRHGSSSNPRCPWWGNSKSTCRKRCHGLKRRLAVFRISGAAGIR